MFRCWNQEFRIVILLGCSPNVNSSSCRKQHEGRHTYSHHMRFQLSDVHVLWSWHHILRIWSLLSAIRGLAIAALPWMLGLWGWCRKVFVKKSLQDEYFPSVLLSPVLQ
jgi:hypothetical protein